MESFKWFILFFLLVKQLAMAEPMLTVNITCCDSDQLLSEDQKCVGLVFSATNQDESAVYKEISKDPLFQCEDGSKRLHFSTENLFNGSIIEPIYNSTVLEKDYCIHPSTQIGWNSVLFCRRPVQIRKCCPLGKIVNRTAVDKCVDVNEESRNLSITNIVDSSYDDWILVQNNVSLLHCDYDYNVYLPGEYIFL